MKRIAFAVFVAVFLFAIGAQAQTPAQTEVEHATQELIKIEKGCAEAYVNKDIAFLDQILADDFMGTDAEGNVLTKAQEFEDLKSDDYVPTSAVNEDIKVRIYGDAAVVTGRGIIKAQYKGKDASGQYQWTDTFIKRDGRWQLVATHSSGIPQK